MINRSLRELPYVIKGYLTSEMAREIIAIPDTEIEYTKEEVEWMVRAIRDLHYMAADARARGLDTGRMDERRLQIETILNLFWEGVIKSESK